MELSILGIGFVVGLVARVGVSLFPTKADNRREPVLTGARVACELPFSNPPIEATKERIKAEPLISEQDFLKTVMGVDPKELWGNKQKSMWPQLENPPQLKNPIASEIPWGDSKQLKKKEKDVKISTVLVNGDNKWVAYTVPDLYYLQKNNTWGKGNMAFFADRFELGQRLAYLGFHNYRYKQIEGL